MVLPAGGVARLIKRGVSSRVTPPAPPRAPRAKGGADGGRTEFPSAGVQAAPQAGGLFLFTERKGKWKRRGGGGWNPLRLPSAGSVSVSQGPTRAARVSGRPGAHSAARAWTTRHAPGPVALAPASAAAGPRDPDAPGSRGRPASSAASRRGTAAGAFGPRGRAEATGDAEFGGVVLIAALRGAPAIPTASGGPGHRRGLGLWGVGACLPPAAAFPSCVPVAAAAGTDGKHLAQGSHGAPPRDSSPFLLLPGSLAREQCRSTQCAGRQGPAVTAPLIACTTGTAALSLLRPGECTRRLGAPMPLTTGAPLICKSFKAPFALRNRRKGVWGGGWRGREPLNS